VNEKRVRGVPVEGAASARNLRERATVAEKILWNELRGRKLDGMKFRRQHALGPFVVDFCCAEQRLVIEVDGEIHDEQRDQDAARSEHLSQYGYHVLRFTNQQVLHEIAAVLEAIRQSVTAPRTN
jgi:very-short-patch-repair endonuclease